MITTRRAALVFACTTSIAVGAFALSTFAPREARAQLTSKQLKVTVEGGASRTGTMTVSPLTCNSTRGSVLCQVTVSNPAGPLVHPTASAAAGRLQQAGLLGCALFTHSVAEGRALVAQLTDPNGGPVACGDTNAKPAPPPTASVLQIDLTQPGAAQSFSF